MKDMYISPVSYTHLDVYKRQVLVSGSPVGIYMETKGVLVIDSGEITDREGIRRTPAEHIIQSGDYICEDVYKRQAAYFVPVHGSGTEYSGGKDRIRYGDGCGSCTG